MPEIWIGRAEIEQRPGTGWLPDRNYAYTITLAYAETETAFRDACRAFWDEKGFNLVDLSDAEPIGLDYATNWPVDEIESLVSEVKVTGSAQHGTLHTWRSEDD